MHHASLRRNERRNIAFMQSRPPLIAVRAFEAAARHLSFIGAADELSVTPAAISHHVKRLEDALGQRLFDRSNRSVRLTRVGMQLSRRVSSILAELDGALLEAAGGHGDRLRITALPSLAIKWLMPQLRDFESQHPDIDLNIDASDALANPEADSFDIALRYGLGSYPGLRVDLLMPADVVAVCSPQLLAPGAPPINTPGDLAHQRLLHDSTHGRFNASDIPNWRLWLQKAGALNVDGSRGPVFGSIHLALDAAVAARGVALAPYPLVWADIQAQRLVRLFPEMSMPNPYAFWIACPSARSDDGDVAAFREWALARARLSIISSSA